MTALAHPARLAFVSTWDASDPNCESGYAFSMRQQLKRRFDVVDLFPIAPKRMKLFLPLKLAFKLTGQYYHANREPVVLRGLARAIEVRLKAVRPDIVFAPSSVPMTYVDMAIPTVFTTDQVFASLLDNYVHNAARRFRALGAAQEATALSRATRVSFPSQWAADQAHLFFGADRAKIDVIPWGANLSAPIDPQRVETAISARPKDCCQLVFIGRDWSRKGGPKVLEIFDALVRRGLPTALTIIGCAPRGADRNGITIYRNLDKTKLDHQARFEEVMLRTHFLLLPSRAEAFGQAVCEACAFGVPAIGSTAGGLTTIIQDGVTGFIRSADGDAAEIAETIASTLEDRDRYQTMARGARRDFLERLNWDIFGAKLARILHTLL